MPSRYLLLVMCTVAGGTITHSLVPPTPGPLFAAQALGVPLWQMIWMGTVIGTGAALFGVAFAHFSNRRHTLEIPAEDKAVLDSAPQRKLPPLWLALVRTWNHGPHLVNADSYLPGTHKFPP